MASLCKILATAAILAMPGAAVAQDRLDQSDAGIVQRELTTTPEMQAPEFQLDYQNIDISQASTGDVEDGVFVAAVRVESALLPPDRFIEAYQPFLGRSLSSEDLRRMTSAIARILQDEGYVFATAWIAPQQLNTGVLRVSVDNGVVSRLSYVGARNAAVERILSPLANSEPVRANELERRLLLARDIPGVILSDPQFFRRDGQGILQIAVSENTIEGYVGTNNHGSESVGPWRSFGSVRFRNIAGDGDELTISAAGTPFEPGDYLQGGISYRRVIGSNGTQIGVNSYLASSDPDSRFSNDVDGQSFGVGTFVSHPLIRSRDASLWTALSLNHRQSEQDRDGFRVRDDSVTTAEVRLNGYTKLAGGWWSGNVRLTQGLGVFSATREGDAFASRFDGDGRFLKIEAYARWYRPLGNGFSLELTGQAQAATRPLLAGEEMGIGGPRFGRGYDYYERSGENGIAGAIELIYDLNNLSDIVDNVQIYSYADAAGVRNIGAGRGGGRLTSAGGGVRVRLADRFRLGVEAGLPLNNDRFDSDDRSPRLRFVFGVNF